MSYCIDEIRIKQFLLFEKCNSAFSRIIMGCIRADKVSNTAFNVSYKALFKLSQNKEISCRLTYVISKDSWYITSEINSDISYKLITATDNIVDILADKDVFTFYYNDTYLNYKVVKVDKKHNTIFVEDMQSKTNHRIGTILNRYNSKYIVSVTTYDSKINKQKGV